MKLIIVIISLNCYFFIAKSTVAQNPKITFIKGLEKPQFLGDEQALNKYLADNVRYTERAIDAGVQGTVRVNFVIRKDGSVSNITVPIKLGYGLDEVAIRVVKSMPRWSPAKINGKPVHYVYQLPIKFVLQ